MIGPHQGKELELMLAGRKHLALFYDVFTDGHENNEIIIPEESFKPYVDSGAILRHSRDITAAKDGTVITYVCFTLPGHAWRAEAFFWIVQQTIGGGAFSDHAFETIIGRLLGYSEEDIQDYIKIAPHLNRDAR